MTQWTDAGREHSQVNGYSQSGAIDWFSFQLANALCGKTLNSAALEVMAGNIEFSVSSSCLMSITGAISDISINGERVVNRQLFMLKQNDYVKIGPAVKGLFSYIAFSATFELPVFANSVCAVKRENIGGTHGDGNSIANGEGFPFVTQRTISKNASRSFNNDEHNPMYTPMLQDLIQSQFAQHKFIPFSFCYQQSSFSSIEKQRFVAHQYEVTQYIDKMGVRMTGPPVQCDVSDLTSQPMANGAIQIPGNGMPIIMRNERQTIGGYPVIGTVNSAGLAILSQATTFQTITFMATDFDTSIIWRQLIDIQLKQVLNKAMQMLSS
ncbi:MAG: allophanate hydrolase [Alphaproteobacteria bacterium]|jgi:allophanate hydrolase